MKKKKKIWRRGGRGVFGQEEKRGLCCVKMRKNEGLYIGKGGGLRFGHMGGFGWEIDFEF